MMNCEVQSISNEFDSDEGDEGTTFMGYDTIINQ